MDHRPADSGISVEAEHTTTLGRVALFRTQRAEPIDVKTCGELHHLQLSLHQVNGSFCFPESWGPHRFEPVGQLFLSPAGQAFHARSDRLCQQSVVCQFDAKALERWFDNGIEWTNHRLESILDIGDAEIRRMLLRIGRELRQPTMASDAMIELAAGQIAIDVSRYLHGIEVRGISGGLARWRLRLIDDYLTEHAAKASLSDLAKLCRLSIRHLSRAFRQSKGCSIGSYIGSFRMDLARRLLLRGVRITHVSAELGFTSPANFSTAFLKATGERPSQCGSERYALINGAMRPNAPDGEWSGLA